MSAFLNAFAVMIWYDNRLTVSLKLYVATCSFFYYDLF